MRGRVRRGFVGDADHERDTTRDRPSDARDARAPLVRAEAREFAGDGRIDQAVDPARHQERDQTIERGVVEAAIGGEGRGDDRENPC